MDKGDDSSERDAFVLVLSLVLLVALIRVAQYAQHHHLWERADMTVHDHSVAPAASYAGGLDAGPLDTATNSVDERQTHARHMRKKTAANIFPAIPYHVPPAPVGSPHFLPRLSRGVGDGSPPGSAAGVGTGFQQSVCPSIACLASPLFSAHNTIVSAHKIGSRSPGNWGWGGFAPNLTNPEMPELHSAGVLGLDPVAEAAALRVCFAEISQPSALPPTLLLREVHASLCRHDLSAMPPPLIRIETEGSLVACVQCMCCLVI